MKEISLIGSILIDPAAFKVAQRFVNTSDFADPSCAAAFSAACSLAAQGESIDPVTVRSQAKKDGVELSVDWVRQAMEITPTAANAEHYARLVAEDAKLRQIKSLAARITDGGGSSDELMAELVRGLGEIRNEALAHVLKSPGDRIHSLFDKIVNTGPDQFIPSGYSNLDKQLGGGFLRGGLYIIGARPAVGKTTFAINLAEQIKGDVLFVSLEMSGDSITAKQFSRLTGIPSPEILAGTGGDELWQKLAQASGVIEMSGVYLNAQYDLTPGQLHTLAQNVPDLRAIIIDYLGLVLPSVPCGSTYERTTAISRDLKRLALQLNVPVICLAQLSRNVESREDKRPRLSDLRDSGAIEQDADAVMFLYRGDYYDPNLDDGGPSMVELMIAKNRHGRLGRVDFAAYLQTGYFKECEVYRGQ